MTYTPPSWRYMLDRLLRRDVPTEPLHLASLISQPRKHAHIGEPRQNRRYHRSTVSRTVVQRRRAANKRARAARRIHRLRAGR